MVARGKSVSGKQLLEELQKQCHPKKLLVIALVANTLLQLHGRCRLVCKHSAVYSPCCSETWKFDTHQKQRTFTFKIKAVPYCCNQHSSKSATFTLKANQICLQFVLLSSHFHYHLASGKCLQTHPTISDHFSLATSGCQGVTD